MKEFCVIGGNVRGRTWKETQEEAVAHAKALAVEHYTKDLKPVRFFVVRMVQVVEAGQPNVTTRDPTPEDTATEPD